MEKKIAAKPTTYAGVQFHSRLEARHAVFYDTLGVPWKYEPYTFEFNNGWTYTPDFELDLDTPSLIEVKPVYPNAEYLEILAVVAEQASIILAVGGFWKKQLPEYFDLPEEHNVEARELFRKGRTYPVQTITRATVAACSYRFDI